MHKNIAAKPVLFWLFVSLMLLIELMLISLTTWQYGRWQQKLNVSIEYSDVTGEWNTSAGAWVWQGVPVRVMQQKAQNAIVVVGGENQSWPIRGIMRPWQAQHGWLKGPIYNVNERDLLRLDKNTFEMYHIADAWLDARSDAPATLDGLAPERHLQYMLTWLALALILPVLLLRWAWQKK